MAITTYPLNGIDYVAEDAETYLCTRISGVFSDDDCYAVTVTGTRQITVSPGLAWIQNTDHCGKSVYNSANYKISVPVADGSNPRIDRVVLHFDKYANETTLELLTGTPAASPKAPAITQTETIYELGLATIYVGAATVVLDQSNITDTRLDESVCGLMRDAVTGIPTQELYDQWQAWYAAFVVSAETYIQTQEDNFDDWYAKFKTGAEEQLESERQQFEAWMTANGNDFNEWFENLQYVLDGDVAGHLELEIEKLQEKLADLKNTVYSLHGLMIPFAIYTESINRLILYAGTDVPKVGETYGGYVVDQVFTGFCDEDATPAWNSLTGTLGMLVVDSSFADVKPKYMHGWFQNVGGGQMWALDSFFEGLENIDTSECVTMSHLFASSGLKDKDIDQISGWDTSKVQYFMDAFYYCNKELTNVDGLANWDLSSAVNLGEMFMNCSEIKTIDISKWDSRNVANMVSMFQTCTALTTIYSDDDVFVTSGTTSAYNGYLMFYGCTNLVGGNGTRCLTDSQNISSAMAHVDVADNPGYFTKK